MTCNTFPIHIFMCPYRKGKGALDTLLISPTPEREADSEAEGDAEHHAGHHHQPAQLLRRQHPTDGGRCSCRYGTAL